MHSTQAKVTVGAHPWVYAASMPQCDITPELETIFADMSAAGMQGIELMSNVLEHEDAVDRITRLSDEYGLPVIGSSHGAAMWDAAQQATIVQEAERVIPRLGQVGGRTLGVSVGASPGGTPKTPAQIDTQAEVLSRLMGICDDNGVVLNLHNHTYEVDSDLHDLGGTLERIPEVKLGPDLNWLLRGGVDPVWFIRKYADQIVFLHLRDQQADGKWPEALGEGDMDYAAIAQALRDIGFAGDAVIELAHEPGFERTRPLRESLRMSREFVRQTFGW